MNLHLIVLYLAFLFWYIDKKSVVKMVGEVYLFDDESYKLHFCVCILYSASVRGNMRILYYRYILFIDIE